MSLDAESFLSLCEKLRAMGATRIEGYGFIALFPDSAPRTRTAAAPAAGQKQAKAKRAAPERVSDEELRELARRRELGL